MFDPSIFLHETTLKVWRAELEKTGSKAYVPARFLTVATSSFAFRPTSPAIFFGTEGETEQVAGAFRDWDWKPYLVPYEAPDEADEDDEVGQALLQLEGADEDVRRILFEEWWYLQHESWLKAAKDACAKAFVKAGALAHDVGEDAFNAVIDQAEDVPELLKRPGVRKAGKWTLVVGVNIGVGAGLLALFPVAPILPGLLVANGPVAAQALAKRVMRLDGREKGLKGFLKFDP